MFLDYYLCITDFELLEYLCRVEEDYNTRDILMPLNYQYFAKALILSSPLTLHAILLLVINNYIVIAHKVGNASSILSIDRVSPLVVL